MQRKIDNIFRPFPQGFQILFGIGESAQSFNHSRKKLYPYRHDEIGHFYYSKSDMIRVDLERLILSAARLISRARERIAPGTDTFTPNSYGVRILALVCRLVPHQIGCKLATVIFCKAPDGVPNPVEFTRFVEEELGPGREACLPHLGKCEVGHHDRDDRQTLLRDACQHRQATCAT
jgi:hypothetical protein